MIKTYEDIEEQKAKYAAADDNPFARNICADCEDSFIEHVDDSFSHGFGTEIIRYDSLECIHHGDCLIQENCPKVRIAIALASVNNDRCTKCDDVGSGKCGSFSCNDFPQGRARIECISCEKLEIELTKDGAEVYCMEEACKYDRVEEIMEMINQEG